MRSRIACLVVALGGACGAACAGSTASPSPTEGGAETHGGSDADVDLAAGACLGAPDLTAATPNCNIVVNNATAVPFTQGTGTPPTPAGGTIRDGLYEATRAEGYGGATPAGRRLTLVVLNGATRFFFAGEVLDAAGTQTTLDFRVNATASVSGTRVVFTAVSCMSTATSPLPPALDFTDSGDNLIMALTSGATTSVTTYTRRGCP
jgi:hypothetical protein